MQLVWLATLLLNQSLLMKVVMNKLIWVLVFALLIGCQSSQVKEERLRLVEQTDDVVLCYSLLDDSFQLDQTEVLKELKKRQIDSCLNTIAEHECPETVDLKQACVEETKIRVTGKFKADQSTGGTELLIKGVQVGIGVLPF
jgi:hypothetical protein